MLSLPRTLIRPIAALALAGAAVLPLAGTVLAYTDPYTPGNTGYDVSYPQCSGTLGFSGNGFAVVGVTGGRPYTSNSCFQAEYGYAGAPSAKALYMNLAAPVGKSATATRTSQPRTCKSGDKACQGYNYGWNAAADAYSYANSKGAQSSTWWLDIETANSWLSSGVNQQTIQGAVDYLQKSAGVPNVGIYSSPSMWNSITGSWKDSTTGTWPVWYAGNSGTACTPTSFTGGPVWLVQNASAATNGDRAC